MAYPLSLSRKKTHFEQTMLYNDIPPQFSLLVYKNECWWFVFLSSTSCVLNLEVPNLNEKLEFGTWEFGFFILTVTEQVFFAATYTMNVYRPHDVFLNV
jgi:hypothetical protein